MQGHYVYTEEHKHIINTQTSVPLVAFEPTPLVAFEPTTQADHAVDRMSTVVGTKCNNLILV